MTLRAVNDLAFKMWFHELTGYGSTRVIWFCLWRDTQCFGTGGSAWEHSIPTATTTSGQR